MQIEAKDKNGALVILNVDTNGNLKVSNNTAKLQSQVLDKNVYYAANQTARAWSIALDTTYTGLVVSNPVASGKNLIILKASFALSVAPAAIASIGIITGYLATANVTHTASVTPVNCFLGGPDAVAKADSQATLPVAPTWAMPIMGGFTAAALPATSPSVIDIDGAIVVPPGGFVGIAALTAVTGFGSFIWQEVNI